MLKNPIQDLDLIGLYFPRGLKRIGKPFCAIPESPCEIVHAEHSAKQADHIDHYHYCKENEIINQNTDRPLAHIKRHSYSCSQNCQKQQCVCYLFSHNHPP